MAAMSRTILSNAYVADDTFKCIFMNENIGIPIFVHKGSINNIQALV